MVARANGAPHTSPATAVLEPEVLSPGASLGALEQMTRGEIDIQIATAKRFPRSIEAFKQKAMTMATIDKETAASCFYVLPKRKGSEKVIDGPSVRLAEIVASAWGHMRIAGRIVEEADRYVVAQGVAWDVENNVLRSSEVRRRITTSDGRRYSEDMITVTCNAAIAIATRNAVFQVIPQSYSRAIYLECRKVAAGDAKTLSADRAVMLEYFKGLNVTPAQIFAVLNVRGLDDIGFEQMITLRGLATAIRDGETTVADTFAAPQPGTDPNGGDQVATVIAETGADEATARQIVARFDVLQLKPAERQVRIKAHKGRAAELLAALTPSESTAGASEPHCAAGEPTGALSEPQQPPRDTASATSKPAGSGRFRI